MAPDPRTAVVGGLVIAVLVLGVLGTGVLSLDGDDRSALAELTGPGNPLATDALEHVNGTADDQGTAVRSETPTGDGQAVADDDGTGTAAVTLTDDVRVTDTERDADGDGLSDARERELGTDPHDSDTDGDGLGDSTELAGDTSPVAVDTDSDGIDDGRERELDTDPARADTDADGLPDGSERETGTDPFDPDTDGDQLADGWEVRERIPDRGTRLPNASATRKDVYVQVLYGQFSTPFTEREKDVIEEEFERMSVANPDGSRGIAVHVVDERPRGGLLNDSVRVTGPGESFENLSSTYETAEYMGPRLGVYHLVVVGQVDAGNETGFGEAPGLVSVVEEHPRGSYPGDAPVRERTVVHELLHNVVGAFTVAGDAGGGSDRYHVLKTSRYRTTNYNLSAQAYYNLYGSYLIGPPRPISYYGDWNLSQPVRRELAVNGFKAPAGERFPPANTSEPGRVVAHRPTATPCAACLAGPPRLRTAGPPRIGTVRLPRPVTATAPVRLR